MTQLMIQNLAAAGIVLVATVVAILAEASRRGRL